MTQKFTDFQIDFARTFNINPALAPASEDAMVLPDTNPGGFKRQAPVEVVRVPTVEEQKQQIASIYGLRADLIELPEAENEAAKAAAAALDERRMARRAELQQKYGCPRPEDIPLEWLSDVT